MRRADRLFQIIQNLHHDKVTTARDLAHELNVSERTIYRDVQDLSLCGVPIVGETGTGYRLMKGYQLPPLMFSEEELAALLIGARMVQAWTDQTLAKAANQALKKIENIIPDRLRPELDQQSIIIPNLSKDEKTTIELTIIRKATQQKNKLVFNYQKEDMEKSRRTVHPLGIFYWGKVWTLVAWCLLRDDFRHFRLDRMNGVAMQDDHFAEKAGQTLDDFMKKEWCP